MKLSNCQHPDCTHHRTIGLPANTLKKIRKGQDVVAGKGEYIKQLNDHYRHLIRHYHLDYHHAKTNQAKRAVAKLVLEVIHKDGGRFLNTQCEEMEEKRAMEKVMKALKDAKKHCSECCPTVPVVRPSTPPKESNVEPNQDFDSYPVLPPVISHFSDEEIDMEPLNLDASVPPSELAHIDSFNFESLGTDNMTVEDTGDPLDYSWAL